MQWVGPLRSCCLTQVRQQHLASLASRAQPLRRLKSTSRLTPPIALDTFLKLFEEVGQSPSRPSRSSKTTPRPSKNISSLDAPINPDAFLSLLNEVDQPSEGATGPSSKFSKNQPTTVHPNQPDLPSLTKSFSEPEPSYSSRKASPPSPQVTSTSATSEQPGTASDIPTETATPLLPLGRPRPEHITRRIHYRDIHPEYYPFPKPRGSAWRDFLGSRADAERLRDLSRLNAVPDPEDRLRAKRRFRIWKRAFGDAWKALLAGNVADSRDLKFVPRKSLDLGQVQLQNLIRLKDIEKMRVKWLESPQKNRIEGWQHLMADALQLAPDRFHEVLQATFEEEASPAHVVKDCLNFFVQRYRSSSPEQKPEHLAKLHGLLLYILRNCSSEYVPRHGLIPQNVLYWATRADDSKALLDIFMELKIRNHVINGYTKLQFASVFANDPPYKRTALAILQELVRDDGFKLNGPHGLALCTSILSYPTRYAREELDGETVRELYEGLLELGIEPNVITFTAIIRVLTLGKDMQNAWQVYRIMRERDIQPDMHLLSVLLNGCKLVGDFRSIIQIIQQVQDSPTLADDKPLWNDVIHSIAYVCTFDTGSGSVDEAGGEKRPFDQRRYFFHAAFPLMIKAYAKVYNMKPLETLLEADVIKSCLETAPEVSLHQPDFADVQQSLISLVESIQPREQLLEPEPYTLGIVIMAYIKSSISVFPIIAFYHRFRTLLLQNDPIMAGFIKANGTLVHDTLIMELGAFDGMLRVGLDVLSDMLADAALPQAGRLRGVPLHPAPSIFTWSIMLKVLTARKQFKQAERLLQMMNEHGIQPTRVTWNTLIAGYALAQSVQGTAEALQRAEQASSRPDDFTMKAFSYLGDKTSALRMMEEMMERRRRIIEKKRLNPDDSRPEYKEMLREVASISEGVWRQAAEQAVNELRLPYMVQVAAGHAEGALGKAPMRTARLDLDSTSPTSEGRDTGGSENLSGTQPSSSLPLRLFPQ
ncbi:hypothetical protein B0T25DRAFT_119551 [Lasiosphaeria hispida]|uniref:Pentatricopeptide repeat protein n=1 Tax=Lasiosphaeria hispida TaxID=260671 RepID=A0AAJ0HRF5_9PEZI|nr:hypothetical protein B0T25DRAFT_119551 [Lasiosphaeria hispida]